MAEIPYACPDCRSADIVLEEEDTQGRTWHLEWHPEDDLPIHAVDDGEGEDEGNDVFTLTCMSCNRVWSPPDDGFWDRLEWY